MNIGWHEMSAAHFSIKRIAMRRSCTRLLWSELGRTNLPFPYSTRAAYELYPAQEMHFYFSEQLHTAA